MDDDLYNLLGISKDATKAEVKKAFHKAALTSHPDKVPESERSDAEIRFKSVSRAYEILYDDDSRHLYDAHGMAAFDKSGGGPGPGDVNLEEMFEHLFSGGGPSFGFGASGFGSSGGQFFFDPSDLGGGGPPGAGKNRKGPDEEQDYEVTLEDLYKGKTTKFASTKKVVCSHCKGTGGKEKAKTMQCGTCRGSGTVRSAVSIGQGLVTTQTHACNNCHGTGQVYKDKDKCKKCKGERTVSEKKYLELYVPPGARDGEKVVLRNEADQRPNDSEPGDLVFILREQNHEVFTRQGPDLSAILNVTLSEALTGLDRVVLKHLDGRGISVNTKQSPGKILRPGQILKVKGEGMPIKKTDHRGDLYLIVKVEFPEDDWLKDDKLVETLRKVLPGPRPSIKTDVVDEVEVEEGNLEEFGAGEDNEEEWEDDDEHEHEMPQCATQ